ncbi:MAG TPA: hypothetical protein PLQ00_14825 [Thermoguttaceae bacterium]|nr:hypothetical protein [Thermoguttaceae bacterium]
MHRDRQEHNLVHRGHGVPVRRQVLRRDRIRPGGIQQQIRPLVVLTPDNQAPAALCLEVCMANLIPAFLHLPLHRLPPIHRLGELVLRILGILRGLLEEGWRLLGRRTLSPRRPTHNLRRIMGQPLLMGYLLMRAAAEPMPRPPILPLSPARPPRLEGELC